MPAVIASVDDAHQLMAGQAGRTIPATSSNVLP